MSCAFPCYTEGTEVYPCSLLLERCTWNSTEVGINSINSSSCSSKHFVVCAVFAQGTWCGFTQRLLHSASGNTINLKRISVKEVITIVLMWTCSSILNLLNPMPWQVWNLIILQGQFFFFFLSFSAMHICQTWILYFCTQERNHLCWFCFYTKMGKQACSNNNKEAYFPLKKDPLFFKKPYDV